ncbi:PspC domain-containing protein [Candidatus Woesearchaeota archaeon]|nr:PspC domain-containing protein [Candidatus Woesearchaeota archaeon]
MKQLLRSKKNRMIAGVCGGLGRYLDVDPTVVRVIFAVFTILSLGTGIIIYLLLWILIPEEPRQVS